MGSSMSTDPQPPFEGVAVVRLRPLYFVVAAAVLAALPGALITQQFQHLQEEIDLAQRQALLTPGTSVPSWGPGLANLFLTLLGLLLIFLPLLLMASRWVLMKRAVPTSVGVRDDHLTIDGKAVAPLGAISSALVIPGDGDDRTVSLERSRGRTIELRVRGDDQAAALLRALGLGATQWAASYPLGYQSRDPRQYLGLSFFVLAMFSNSVGSFLFGSWSGLGTLLMGVCCGMGTLVSSGSRSGTPKERIRALRALGQEGKQGYRAAPVPTEQLWRVFECAANDAETRAAAAIALRERLDASSVRRLRIVAAATAEPKLRIAIESAARDDDAALEEALAALDSDVEEEKAVRGAAS